MNRYSRHIILPEIGQEGQEKLSKAKVLVIGSGGLGCPILQYLAAAGIGTLGIVDFDTVELSNLQRQVLFGTSDLGKNKALTAKKRLSHLNDTITIHAYPYQLTYKNALELFQNYDIIVDGSDNFPTRYLVNDACIISRKPLVYGAIFKFEGQVCVFNYKNGPSYRCLFPNPPKEGTVANCSEIGVLGVLPGIIGSMQANEVLKIVLDLGTVLNGKLLLYNAMTAQITSLTITRSELQIDNVMSRQDSFHEQEDTFHCEPFVPEIEISDLSLYHNIQFIDIREHHETPKLAVEDLIQIPLSELEERLNEIDTTKENILFCATGIRSSNAVTILQKHNINNCFSLKEGVMALMAYYEKNVQEHERT